MLFAVLITEIRATHGTENNSYFSAKQDIHIVSIKAQGTTQDE